MTGKIVGEKYFLDGVEVTKRLFYKRMRTYSMSGTGQSLTGWKPLVSSALAVHPNQVDEAVQHAQELGVPTEFQKDGRPIFRTRAHRKEYMRRYGFFDRDGGYGDAQPGQTSRDIPDPPNLAELY